MVHCPFVQAAQGASCSELGPGGPQQACAVVGAFPLSTGQP